MSLAVISLLVFIVIIIISCFIQRLNPGLLSLAAALILGMYWGNFSLSSLLLGFPTQLFLLLVSMNLIFGVAEQNGTLQIVTQRLIGLVQGRVILLPLIYFFLAFIIAAVGPGNIAAVAVLAPLTMALSRKYGISPLITAIMICTGANAGAFSPFAPTGIVAIGLMQKISLPSELIWTVFGSAAILQALSALGAYTLFIVRAKRRGFSLGKSVAVEKNSVILKKNHLITGVVVAALLLGVIVLKLQLLPLAVVLSIVLFLLRQGEEEKVFAAMPWSTIFMVTGIAVLIALLEKTGGLEVATSFIASVTRKEIIHGVMAGVTGIVSAYSSSSGVVMPAFIPLIPGLAEKIGITVIVPLVISVAVGSHMVDVSPLSTLGALSLAAIESKKEQKRVFRLLLAWGMIMAFIGAVLAFLFLDIPYILFAQS
jgi:Na+/H+ antiporter NhaD/arsenite permease-like protein